LALVAAAPEMGGLDLEPIEVTAECGPRGCRLSIPGCEIFEGSARSVSIQFFQHLVLRVEVEAPGAPVIHGASIRSGQRRLVLLGRKMTGKSTLALHLLANGLCIEGDEHVVVRENDAITRPRLIFVREGSLTLVPAVAEFVRSCPFDHDENGTRYFAVNPQSISGSWRLQAGPIDQIVFAEPNHGGPSFLTPLDPDKAFGLLLEESWLPETRQAIAVARLRKVALKSGCWLLKLGNLEQAEWHLRRMLAETIPSGPSAT
jgi:hypothetical protein